MSLGIFDNLFFQKFLHFSVFLISMEGSAVVQCPQHQITQHHIFYSWDNPFCCPSLF